MALSEGGVSAGPEVWVKTEFGAGYLGKIWVFVDDGLEQFHSVLTSKRRESSDHLMEKTAQAPPIHIHSMSHLLHDFWREVLRSPADRVGSLLVLQDLAQPEVSKLDVSDSINDDIFWFKAVYS